MKINTYVVSLKNELDRRENISTQLAMEFEYIDAVDLRSISVFDAQKYVIDNRKYSHSPIKKNLTNGEIGCSLSHVEVYKRFARDNADFALVLEDDAIVPKNIMDIVNELCDNSISSSWDILLLGYSKLERNKANTFYKMEPLIIKKQINLYGIGMPWKNWTSGTVGYLIKKDAAQKISNSFNDNKISTVADDWSFYEDNFGLNILHLRPLVVFEDFKRLDSAIESERNTFVSNETISFDFLRVCRGFVRKLVMYLK